MPATASRAPEVRAIAAVFLVLTWLTTCLRVYVKGFMVKSFAAEDWVVIAALIFFTATAVLALQGINFSLGMHLVDVPKENIIPAMRYWFWVELAYVATTGALKMSIGVFLLRIATQKVHRWILISTLSVVVLTTSSYFLFLVLQCAPVDFYWNQFAGEAGSCLPAATVGGVTYAHSGVNAAADVILSLLPVVIVSQLQMNPRTKITVCTILSLGVFACAAVITRIPYVKALVDDAQDFLFASTDVVIWSAIEPGLAITAANMATLRPLFSAFLSHSKLWGTTHNLSNAKSSFRPSKATSRFSSGRHGYIRSGSRGNVDEMGVSLQGMSKSGFVVTAVDGASGELEWNKDLESGRHRAKSPVDEWPAAGITKTTRLDVSSEVGSEMNSPGRAMVERERKWENRKRSESHSRNGSTSRPVRGLSSRESRNLAAPLPVLGRAI